MIDVRFVVQTHVLVGINIYFRARAIAFPGSACSIDTNAWLRGIKKTLPCTEINVDAKTHLHNETHMSIREFFSNAPRVGVDVHFRTSERFFEIPLSHSFVSMKNA